MNVRANVDKKFILRFLIISVCLFGFMLWALYDGLYKYPKEIKRSEAFFSLQSQVESGGLSEADRAEQWEEMCDQYGWSKGTMPKEAKLIEEDIRFQWILAAIGLVGGVFFMVKYLRLLGSWMEADDNGITTSWGSGLSFDKVKELDKKKWAKKGIAKVSYDDGGKDRVMTLDDFKYEREDMGKIIKRVESSLKDNQIVGGAREKSDEIVAIEDEEE